MESGDQFLTNSLKSYKVVLIQLLGQYSIHCEMSIKLIYVRHFKT